MAVSDYHSTRDLSGIDYEGLINEDVMQQIWDISKIPLPFSDAVGSDDVDDTYASWVEDELAQPNTANAVGETAEITAEDSKNGARIGNRCQLSVKQVGVTHRAQAVDTIGYSDELAYQIMMRQQELRRDVEAISLTNQGSAEGATEADADTTAALGACITQGDEGSSTGGGFSSGDWTERTPGTNRALTEAMVRDVAQTVWEEGGDPSILMSVPKVIRQLSAYMFTSSARIATLSAETNQNGPATAMGSVNVFLTDFGVELQMIPNRLQQKFEDDAESGTPDTANVYILDPAYARLGYLQGYRVDPMAKTRMADTRLMSVDWMVRVLNRKAHGIIADIDPELAVTES